MLPDLERPISDIVPHIFKRPVLRVSSDTPLLEAGIFLALGPQIYVDGLVVIDDNMPVGRIGSHGLIKFILEHPDDLASATANKIMLTDVSAVEATESLASALNIFRTSRFAFVAVAIDGSVVTSLSLRDCLRAASRLLPDLPGYNLTSPLVSTGSGASVGRSLETMLEKGIRNLAIVDDERDRTEGMRLINDRKILEFLMSHQGMHIMSTDGTRGLYEIPVAELDLTVPNIVGNDISARKAADLLTYFNNPCLLLSSDRILTPWDVIMKGLYKEQSLI